jgi:hypothetical protein
MEKREFTRLTPNPRAVASGLLAIEKLRTGVGGYLIALWV